MRKRSLRQSLRPVLGTRLLAGAVLASLALAPETIADDRLSSRRAAPVASILAYHRFGAAVTDSMTVRTATFRRQLEYLAHHGYTIVPLRDVAADLRGTGPAVPAGSVVITVDDGHRTVFTEMLPIVRELGLPVTLFIYPSAISNAPYAMTWEQLREAGRTGLVDIQSHTYWHPNFLVEKRRLPPPAYRTFVTRQLASPCTSIRQKIGTRCDMLAWPFGVYDDELQRMAAGCGYVAGVTLDRRIVTRDDRVLALPRFLVTDAATGAAFRAMLPEVRP